MSERAHGDLLDRLREPDSYELFDVLRRATRIAYDGQLSARAHPEVRPWGDLITNMGWELERQGKLVDLESGTRYWRASRNPIATLDLPPGTPNNVFFIKNKPIDIADVVIFGVVVTQKSHLITTADVDVPPALLFYGGPNGVHIADSPLLCPDMYTEVDWKETAEALIEEIAKQRA